MATRVSLVPAGVGPLVIAVALGQACAPAGPPSSPDPGPEATERARSALQPLKQRLMGELTKALSEGGPAHAVRVCQVRAGEIAAELAAEGVRMGRTSHRLRNPDNAPAPWMEPLLAGYVNDPDDREPHVVRIDEDTVGYVEPILVQPLCLPCHGAEPAAEVRDTLAQLYPEDRATGFAAGELRGMFWVTLPVGTNGTD